jgi:hypothetical protein
MATHGFLAHFGCAFRGRVGTVLAGFSASPAVALGPLVPSLGTLCAAPWSSWGSDIRPSSVNLARFMRPKLETSALFVTLTAKKRSPRIRLTHPLELGKISHFRGNSATDQRKVSMLLSDLQNEINRELSLRRNCFPKMVSNGRLSRGEMEERISRLDAVAKLLARLRALGMIYLDQPLTLVFPQAPVTCDVPVPTQSLNTDVVK